MKIVNIQKNFVEKGDMRGTPVVEVELFGCNLTCSGFGQPIPENISSWVGTLKDIDVKGATPTRYPQYDFGCSHNHAIDKRLQHVELTPAQVSARILSIAGTEINYGLSFGGGEPLTNDNQEIIMHILNSLSVVDFIPKRIFINTNGTIPISSALVQVLLNLDIPVHIHIDVKLLNTSGERPCNTLSIEALQSIIGLNGEYSKMLIESNAYPLLPAPMLIKHSTHSMSFVVDERASTWDELEQVTGIMGDSIFNPPNGLNIYIATENSIKSDTMAVNSIKRQTYQKGFFYHE